MISVENPDCCISEIRAGVQCDGFLKFAEIAPQFEKHLASHYPQSPRVINGDFLVCDSQNAGVFANADQRKIAERLRISAGDRQQ